MLNNCYLKAIKAIKLICIKFIISFKSNYLFLARNLIEIK